MKKCTLNKAYVQQKFICYTGCPKKRNARFSLLWYSKLQLLLISSDKTLSSENVWFGSIGSTTISQNAIIWDVLSLFCLHGSIGFRAIMYGSQKSRFPWLKCPRTKRKLPNTIFWEFIIVSKLLNQFQWSWHHSFQKTMFYLMKPYKKINIPRSHLHAKPSSNNQVSKFFVK